MNLGAHREEVSEKARGGDQPGAGRPDFEAMSFELSSRRTSLSFQRTRMSAERTLMSTPRTSLAFISFGFIIFQFFRAMHQTAEAANAIPVQAARNFGLALVFMRAGPFG